MFNGVPSNSEKLKVQILGRERRSKTEQNGTNGEKRNKTEQYRTNGTIRKKWNKPEQTEQYGTKTEQNGAIRNKRKKRNKTEQNRTNGTKRNKKEKTEQ
jgi:hypothetical protein